MSLGQLTRRVIATLCLALCAGAVQAQGDASANAQADAPTSLSISGSFRLRYEHLENTFRRVGPDQDELLVSRLLVHAKVDGQRFYGGLELQDSRAWLHQDLTPLGTDDVNALEPLQAYVGYRTGSLDIQAGRMTMDVGSRRFVSRNRTRNTINGFTGVRARWSQPGSTRWDVFLTMPVARLPDNSEPERLRNNEFELDREHRERVL